MTAALLGAGMDGDEFSVLVNHQGQYSLWPAKLGDPPGWRQVAGPLDRAACLLVVESQWSDQRPNSLTGAMNAHA